MKRALTTALVSGLTLLPLYSFSQERYTVSDLHKLMKGKTDVYVSEAGWIYNARLNPDKDSSKTIVFIDGIKNGETDNTKIKEIFLKAKSFDLMSACTGPELEGVGDYEYVSLGSAPQSGTNISKEYRTAHSEAVNNVVSALSKSK